MHDIVLKISFLKPSGHFYFWPLKATSKNFDGLGAGLRVVQNFQKKIWESLLTQIIQKCLVPIGFFSLGGQYIIWTTLEHIIHLSLSEKKMTYFQPEPLKVAMDRK